MSDDTTRRRFIKWLGVGAGAAVGGLAGGCSGPGRTDRRDGGRADTEAAGMAPDAGGGDADTAGAGEGGRDTGGRDTASPGDGGTDTSGGGPDSAEDGGDAGDSGTCRATGDDVQGPFHEEGAPERTNLAPDDEPGRRILIEGTVYGPDCTTPIPGALLDVWHANEEGDYYDASDDYRLRGQLKTAEDGSYQIRTIKPGRYRTAGGLRPAHVHFTVSSPQHGPLTTQMYFAGDPRLAPTDPCGTCASDDPTLIVDFETEIRNGEEILVGQFDIVLGG